MDNSKNKHKKPPFLTQISMFLTFFIWFWSKSTIFCKSAFS